MPRHSVVERSRIAFSMEIFLPEVYRSCWRGSKEREGVREGEAGKRRQHDWKW